jgi:hypothetical protein
MKGYYSVMQYCPDQSRAEAANVGVVLLTEQPTIAVKTSETFARVKRFFKPDDARLARIMDAVRASATRLQLSIDDVRTFEDLNQFARTMGNDIRLTTPLVIRVNDIGHDLNNLYVELVDDGNCAAVRRAVVLPTVINRVFEELVQAGKITRPGLVRVPLFKQRLRIPYAYRNGVLNYVKPELFVNKADTTDKAARLALEGDQIQKHPLEDELHGRVGRKLVVVSAASSDPDVERMVAPLFAEYGVKYVTQADAAAFADGVRQEAK